MIQRLKHRFRLCGGWLPALVGGKSIIRTYCYLCLDEFEVIEAEWLRGMHE